jgi:Flp pilus assembly protein TadD
LLLIWLFLVVNSPDQTRALLQSGLMALKQGKLQQARADLERAKHLDPKNPYIWSALAEVYLRAKDPKQAEFAAQKAEKNGGHDPVVCHALAMYYAEAGNPGRAAIFEQQYAESPKADGDALNRAAELYWAAGNRAAALPLAQKAAQKSPEVAFHWAQIFLRQEEFTAAASLLDSALKVFPDDPQLMLALGVARYGERRFEDAITAFLKVIQLDPSIEQPYLFLGRVLDQAGSHLSEITKDYEQWSAANPQNANAKLLLAEALLAQDNRSERAELLLKQAIALQPKSWEAHYQLGLVFETRHEYRPAAAEFEQAIQLNANQPMPHYHLARVYDRLGMTDRAKAEREIHQQLAASGR